MIDREESIDDRMKRLAKATDSLRPRPGFEGHVMAAIQAEAFAHLSPSWLSGVVLSSRRVLMTAALAAVAGLAVAAVGDRSANESLAAAYTAVQMEIDW
jgi:hypothetical protein